MCTQPHKWKWPSTGMVYQRYDKLIKWQDEWNLTDIKQIKIIFGKVAHEGALKRVRNFQFLLASDPGVYILQWLSILSSIVFCFNFLPICLSQLVNFSFNNYLPTCLFTTNSWAFCTEHAPNLARNPWGEGVKLNMAAYE